MDYISRGALIEAVQEVIQETPPGDVRGGLSLVFPILSEIPAADVRPVVRGEWIFKWDAEKDPKKLFARIMCSNCGLLTGQKSNFCPNCGAMMGGQDNA